MITDFTSIKFWIATSRGLHCFLFPRHSQVRMHHLSQTPSLVDRVFDATCSTIIDERSDSAMQRPSATASLLVNLRLGQSAPMIKTRGPSSVTVTSIARRGSSIKRKAWDLRLVHWCLMGLHGLSRSNRTILVKDFFPIFSSRFS